MKTRFASFCITLIIVSVLLTACSGTATTSVSNTQSLSTVASLAVGTLKLDGTDQAITSAQASELLTLWQAYQALSINDTAAQVEMDGLVKQIQGTMTSKQLQAIQSMKLTNQSILDVTQSLATNVTSSSNTQGTTSSGQTSSGGSEGAPSGSSGGPAGAGLGGMPGGDGSTPMDDSGIGTNVQSTPAASAQTQSSSQAAQINAQLLNVLIKMLEIKAQSA